MYNGIKIWLFLVASLVVGRRKFYFDWVGLGGWKVEDGVGGGWDVWIWVKDGRKTKRVDELGV